jgi:hypothetical protein
MTQVGKLAEALSKAQKQMQHATKDSVNPHFKSRYADLASVIDAIRIPLSENGLSYVQYGADENNGMFLITRLMHISGEYVEGKMRLVTDKPNMQGLGSALTYARRYGLAAMVGIHQEDDDGNSASVPEPKIQKQAPIVKAGKATDKQLQYCRDLIKKNGLIAQEITDLLKSYGVSKSADLSFEDVSDLIKKLQNMESSQKEQGSFEDFNPTTQKITKDEEF